MDKTNQIIQIISNNTIEILAAVIFLTIITISIIAMFKNNKDEDRADYIKRFILILLAGFIIISAVSISIMINNIITNMNTTITGKSNEPISEENPQMDDDLSFWERGLYTVLDWFAESAIFIKNIFLGKSVGVRSILKDASSNPLVDFRVKYRGSTINLYNLILINSSFLLLLMILRTAYKLVKMSYTPSLRDDVINSFLKWFYVIISIVIVPAVFIALAEITDILMSILNKINIDLILNIDELTLESYGAFAPIAKIYAAYIEFKVWFLMLYRKFIINGFYIVSPIAVYLWGIGDEFEGSKYWLNTILMNMFTPFFYMLCFILGSIIAKSIPNGDNPLVIMIISGLTIKIGDELKRIVQIKSLMSAGATEKDANNMSRGFFQSLMMVNTVKNISRGIGSKGIANNTSRILNSSNSNITNRNLSNMSNSSMNNLSGTGNVFNKTSQMLGKGKEYIGREYELNNIGKIKEGAGKGRNVGNIIGTAINSSKTQKTLSTVAGVTAGIATANPVLGTAVYKGTKALSGFAGKGINKIAPTLGGIAGGVVTGSKDTLNTAGRSINHLKGNTDITAHGRR